MSSWLCASCGLQNKRSRHICQACFAPCHETVDTKIYPDHLSKFELILLICGYSRDSKSNSKPIPTEIIHFISLYHWSQIYQDFNAFKFKQDSDLSLKYCVVPLHEVKQNYLLPFHEIINDNKNNTIIGKYSSFKSKYCPSFIKQSNCMIHEVVLDKNNENIYHLLDSFVVNKFIELFKNVKPNNDLNESDIVLPAGKGQYRAGFRCVGSQKKLNKHDAKWMRRKTKYRKLWKFIGGNFHILLLWKKDKKKFAEKCLVKEFDINLDFDENADQYTLSMFDQYTMDETHNMNDDELMHVLFSCSGLDGRLSGLYSHSYNFVWNIFTVCLEYMSCKQIICEILYRGAVKQLHKNHWIMKKLLDWKSKLNVDEEMKNAIDVEIEESKTVKEEEDNIINNDDPEKPWNGRWSSWTEIQVNDNDIENDVYPFLMTEIVFPHILLNGDWDEQRSIFGKKFLRLFEKQNVNNKVRTFWCQNIAWDMFMENASSCNKMLCCIDDEKLVAVWSCCKDDKKYHFTSGRPLLPCYHSTYYHYLFSQ